MKIEKGKKYRCLKWNGISFSEGKEYHCEVNGYLTGKDGYRIFIYKEDIDSFELVEEPSTEELLKRIEALENEVKFNALVKRIDRESARPQHHKDSLSAIDEIAKQPCPTAAKFKRIADHAQAITNEIASPKEDVIYVPDGIIDSQGSIINNGHCLYFNDGSWEVQHLESKDWFCESNKFKLVPVKREELKSGDVAFRLDNYGLDYRDDLHLYCIILEDGYQFWSGRDCVFATATCKHWYKVVEC